MSITRSWTNNFPPVLSTVSRCLLKPLSLSALLRLRWPHLVDLSLIRRCVFPFFSRFFTRSPCVHTLPSSATPSVFAWLPSPRRSFFSHFFFPSTEETMFWHSLRSGSPPDSRLVFFLLSTARKSGPVRGEAIFFCEVHALLG